MNKEICKVQQQRDFEGERIWDIFCPTLVENVFADCNVKLGTATGKKQKSCFFFDLIKFVNTDNILLTC